MLCIALHYKFICCVLHCITSVLLFIALYHKCIAVYCIALQVYLLCIVSRAVCCALHCNTSVVHRNTSVLLCIALYYKYGSVLHCITSILPGEDKGDQELADSSAILPPFPR